MCLRVKHRTPERHHSLHNLNGMILLKAYNVKDIIYLSYCIILSTSFLSNSYAQKLIDSEIRFSLKASQGERMTLHI